MLINYLDIGARGGVIDDLFLYKEYLNIFSFDPDSHSILKVNPNNKVFPFAIGGENKKMKMYITQDPYCSSLLKPNIKFIKNYPNHDRFKVVKQSNVNVKTLDALYKNKVIPQPDFIKIDAQGLSFQILQKSKTILEKTLLIQVECSYEKIYENEILISPILELLRSYNFEIIYKEDFYWQTKNSASISPQKGNLVWCDLVLIKKFEYLKNMNFFKFKDNFTKYYLLTKYMDYSNDAVFFNNKFNILNKKEFSKIKEVQTINKLRDAFFVKIFKYLPLKIIRYIIKIFYKVYVNKDFPIIKN